MIWYNNNYKILIALISLERIELSGAPSTRVGQTHSPGTIQSSSTNDQMERKLNKKVNFQKMTERNYTI